uniref:YCII-related n=1 Tax=Variovorax paradoxus (strain S110) TaxID=543728 RepID=C5CSY4_VARPS
MQYMLMFYQPAAEFEQRNDASSQAYRASWVAYADAVRQSGISLGGHGLFLPMTGTTLRVRGDKRQVQDGPFADTKEQLGGYFVVDVPDLDAALEWAARAPCAASGGVEVRPVFTATAIAAATP